MIAKKADLLGRMRENPKNDWKIKDVTALCASEGLRFRDGKGSHVVVSSSYLRDSLTVPARRPIKPYYIKELVGFVDAHREHKKESDDG
jgi:hypothetical protein